MGGVCGTCALGTDSTVFHDKYHICILYGSHALGNDQFGVALTIDDNYLYGLDSVSFLWFEDTPWQITKSPMRILPKGKTGLPASSVSGVTKTEGKGYFMKFEVTRKSRVLEVHMDDFKDGQPIDIHIALINEPEESLVVCTPFETPVSQMLSVDTIMTDTPACTTEMLGVRENTNLGQMTLRFSNQRRDSKTLLDVLCPNIFSFV